MWWQYIIIAAVILFGIYGFLTLTSFETQVLSRRTTRRAADLYPRYADSLRTQRRYARQHGGEWVSNDGGPSRDPRRRPAAGARQGRRWRTGQRFGLASVTRGLGRARCALHPRVYGLAAGPGHANCRRRREDEPLPTHAGRDDPIGCAPARTSASQIWRFMSLRPIQIGAADPIGCPLISIQSCRGPGTTLMVVSPAR